MTDDSQRVEILKRQIDLKLNVLLQLQEIHGRLLAMKNARELGNQEQQQQKFGASFPSPLATALSDLFYRRPETVANAPTTIDINNQHAQQWFHLVGDNKASIVNLLRCAVLLSQSQLHSAQSSQIVSSSSLDHLKLETYDEAISTISQVSDKLLQSIYKDENELCSAVVPQSSPRQHTGNYNLNQDMSYLLSPTRRSDDLSSLQQGNFQSFRHLGVGSAQHSQSNTVTDGMTTTQQLQQFQQIQYIQQLQFQQLQEQRRLAVLTSQTNLSTPFFLPTNTAAVNQEANHNAPIQSSLTSSSSTIPSSRTKNDIYSSVGTTVRSEQKKRCYAEDGMGTNAENFMGPIRRRGIIRDDNLKIREKSCDVNGTTETSTTTKQVTTVNHYHEADRETSLDSNENTTKSVISKLGQGFNLNEKAVSTVSTTAPKSTANSSPKNGKHNIVYYDTNSNNNTYSTTSNSSHAAEKNITSQRQKGNRSSSGGYEDDNNHCKQQSSIKKDRKIIPLGTEKDPLYLNPFLTFLRSECIEVFAAKEHDMKERILSRMVKLGQVGIRCRFCAHLPSKMRVCRSSAFPSSISGLYQGVLMMNYQHFSKCGSMPREVKARYEFLKKIRKRGGSDSRGYWLDSARELGLVDVTNEVGEEGSSEGYIAFSK